MTATIIDGRAVSEIMRKKMRSRVESLGLRGLRPGLAVVLVGDDAASQIYVRNKAKACENVGMHSEVFRYPAETSEADVLQKIAELNEDPRIHGILVQLPLPAHVDNGKVLEAIVPHKDVDGFHKQNVGALVTGESNFPPCTPQGVMTLLDHYEVAIEGSNAVVIGRSNIVGKPMALMLLARSATVTVCTSKTRNLSQFTEIADIVVAAVGKPGLLTADMIKEGAAVIDVGMNRLPNGKLVGDVAFDEVKEKAGYITPVPGGVGPMTITMLLANTLKASEMVADGEQAARRATA
ncbi:MAG: bifunctional methylenetetrahydrofolate dehydrogenase/methenyltetrahydrofolate cyclohydrolase FolD [Betaproteobacteria bacterium]|jgi:methylenetetrahydrofolate dehydrogenase (NADP+)/methenyltetrahydrofolate cyclohydrolase|nr:MAG: bifunctional methylenetetrahydrofolate dehydrogenase/methenyltetrahydrofolate cyclohydrolase FolD [Betaproteobacteria bacterium]